MRRPAVLFAASLLAACGGPLPALHRHALEATAPAAPLAGQVKGLRIGIEMPTLPEALDRRQMVLRTADEDVISDAHGWRAPLRQEFAGTLALALATRLPAATVGIRLADADRRIAVAITRFESMPARGIAVAADWTLRGADNAVLHSGRFLFERAVAPADDDDARIVALVAAHRLALAALADELAAALTN